MMNKHINKVAVLGSGVMGAQIAAHLANVQVPVNFDYLTAIRIVGYDVKDTSAAIVGFKRHFMMDTTNGITQDALKVLYQLHKKYL